MAGLRTDPKPPLAVPPDDGELASSVASIAHPYKRAFLIAYATCGTAAAAAKAAGCARRSHGYWLERDPEYALAFEDAKGAFADSLEALLFTRARRRDVPLIVALKGALPHKYKDNPSTYIDQRQQTVAFTIKLGESTPGVPPLETVEQNVVTNKIIRDAL